MNITIVSRADVPTRIPVSRDLRETFTIEDELVIAVAHTAGTSNAVKIEGLTVGMNAAGGANPLDRVSFRSWQVKLRNKLAARGLACSFRFDASAAIVWAWAFVA